MSDRREEILVRLYELLQAEAAEQTGINVYRDRAELDETELPAYVLLDGIETAQTVATGQIRGRRAPALMLLQPQVFYIPKPTENQNNTGVGEALSANRSRLISRIMLDAELEDLLGNNGYIEYRGMDTDMQTGGEVKGQFRLECALAYMLNFNQL